MDIVAFSFQMGGPNKGCMIKHLDRRSGYITLEDASNGTPRVFDYRTDQPQGIYSDVDALIEDGWNVIT